VFAEEESEPALAVAARATIARFDDAEALERFAAAIDVATYEFENVPIEAAERIAARCALRPSPAALTAAQDRLTEKTFLRGLGLGTAPFAEIEDVAGLAAAARAFGGGILKTRRFGYDGKGQARLVFHAPDQVERAAAEAHAAIGARPAILEGFVPFRRELSVIVARSADGAVACYDPPVNEHRGGVLRRSVVDGAVSPQTVLAAQGVAARIVDALDYVGVMGVELFEAENGALLVNEIAPRVHNSGHWTLEACAVSQFEQHIRAVCGWPLGDPRRHSDAEMLNLIGEEAHDWSRLAAEPGASLHLYGKADARPGRKMGHVTRLLGPAANRIA
ncbi:MAG: 5-(carboxyamino)imidazole ribonucleotide synthase, partial [Pseudomonadota bacterium]